MGEWDAQSTSEPIAHQEFTVARIFVHPQYSSSSLINSVAILRLSSNVPLGQVPTITTGCLSTSYISSLRCWVAGWGAQNFVSGATQAIQMQVDVPIVDQATCQTKLRTTRLGSAFTLDTNSFLCAGGEAGKDACTGDGGSPLMCPIAGRWYVVGLVAWGIGEFFITKMFLQLTDLNHQVVELRTSPVFTPMSPTLSAGSKQPRGLRY